MEEAFLVAVVTAVNAARAAGIRGHRRARILVQGHAPSVQEMESVTNFVCTDRAGDSPPSALTV